MRIHKQKVADNAWNHEYAHLVNLKSETKMAVCFPFEINHGKESDSDKSISTQELVLWPSGYMKENKSLHSN